MTTKARYISVNGRSTIAVSNATLIKHFENLSRQVNTLETALDYADIVMLLKKHTRPPKHYNDARLSHC